MDKLFERESDTGIFKFLHFRALVKVLHKNKTDSERDIRTVERDLERINAELAEKVDRQERNITRIVTELNQSLRTVAERVDELEARIDENQDLDNTIASRVHVRSPSPLPPPDNRDPNELPRVNMIGITAMTHSIVDRFSGISDTQWSNWIRRFEDVLAAQHTGNNPMTDEKKVQALCLYLDGPARECVAEMADNDRGVYDTVKERLQETFETDLSRQVARQKLSMCRQSPGESVTAFAEKLRKFVKAVTTGQNPQQQNERLTQEFLDKLNPDVSFHVQATPTPTWALALSKAQLFESLLASHVANRLIHPATNATSANSSDVPLLINTIPATSVDAVSQQFANIPFAQDNNFQNQGGFNGYNQNGWSQRQNFSGRGRGGRGNWNRGGNWNRRGNWNNYNNNNNSGWNNNNRGNGRQSNRGNGGQWNNGQSQMQVPQNNFRQSAFQDQRTQNAELYCRGCNRSGHVIERCRNRVPPQVQGPSRSTNQNRMNTIDAEFSSSMTHDEILAYSAQQFLLEQAKLEVMKQNESVETDRTEVEQLTQQLQRSQAQVDGLRERNVQLSEIAYPGLETAPVVNSIQAFSNGEDPSLAESQVDSDILNAFEEIQRQTLESVRESKRVSPKDAQTSFKKRITEKKFVQLSLPQIPRIIITSMLVMCLCQWTGAQSPMLCQTQTGRTFWSLDNMFRCHVPPYRDLEKPLPTTLEIFRPNTVKYDTAARYCRIISNRVEYSTSFLGYKSRKDIPMVHTVSESDCKSMHMYHKCVYGNMQLIGEMWQTVNKENIEWSGSGFWCCDKLVHETYNCFLFETKVFASHSTAEISSPVADLRKCKYNEEQCQVPDGSLLMWKANRQQKCDFISFTNAIGESMGKSFLSQNGEFALSWLNPIVVNDCSQRLMITDQGYALHEAQVLILKRTKREAREELRILKKRDLNLDSQMAGAGLVTTNQLSSQLLALELNFRRSSSYAYTHAIQASCQNIKMTQRVVQISLTSNPTLAARAILQKQNLHAKSATGKTGESLLEVWPCASLNATNYNFTAQDEIEVCYSTPRIVVNVGGRLIKGYLDPVTHIISDLGRRASCSTSKEIPIQIEGKTFVYHAEKGVLETIAETAKQIQSPISIEHPFTDFPLIIFHNLIITNISEFVSVTQFNSIHRIANFEQQMEQAFAPQSNEEQKFAEKNELPNCFNRFVFISIWRCIEFNSALDFHCLFGSDDFYRLQSLDSGSTWWTSSTLQHSFPLQHFDFLEKVT
jgi:hypothetical protein